MNSDDMRKQQTLSESKLLNIQLIESVQRL